MQARIRVSVEQSFYDAVMNMCQERGATLTQAVFSALEQALKDHKYQTISLTRKSTAITMDGKRLEKQSRKQQIEEHVAQMREMDNETLTAHLYEIGYFTREEGMEDAVVDTELHGRMFRKLYVAPDGSSAGGKDIYTFDEMINNMRKEKKL